MSAEIGLEQVRVRVLPDGRLSRRDAAAMIGIAAETLANWSIRGQGPRAHKVGNRAFYFLKEVQAFCAGREAA